MKECIIIVLAIVCLILNYLVFKRELKKLNKRKKRNKEVFEFLNYINTVLCKEYGVRRYIMGDMSEDDIPQDWFLGKYEYEDFLNSNKPLTLEDWWTKEEIEKLMS